MRIYSRFISIICCILALSYSSCSDDNALANLEEISKEVEEKEEVVIDDLNDGEILLFKKEE